MDRPAGGALCCEDPCSGIGIEKDELEWVALRIPYLYWMALSFLWWYPGSGSIELWRLASVIKLQSICFFSCDGNGYMAFLSSGRTMATFDYDEKDGVAAWMEILDHGAWGKLGLSLPGMLLNDLRIEAYLPRDKDFLGIN